MEVEQRVSFTEKEQTELVPNMRCMKMNAGRYIWGKIAWFCIWASLADGWSFRAGPQPDQREQGCQIGWGPARELAFHRPCARPGDHRGAGLLLLKASSPVPLGKGS